MPLLIDKEADLSISDNETKQENKVQTIRTLGTKIQNQVLELVTAWRKLVIWNKNMDAINILRFILL